MEAWSRDGWMDGISLGARRGRPTDLVQTDFDCAILLGPRSSCSSSPAEAKEKLEECAAVSDPAPLAATLGAPCTKHDMEQAQLANSESLWPSSLRWPESV